MASQPTYQIGTHAIYLFPPYMDRAVILCFHFYITTNRLYSCSVSSLIRYQQCSLGKATAATEDFYFAHVSNIMTLTI